MLAFLKNRHVVTAMIVAPLLAVIAWFAVDRLVAERPHVAREGRAYPLIARSDCRYTSGQCSLENASFKSTLRYDQAGGTLSLKSSHALQNATIGFVTAAGHENPPRAMNATDASRQSWRLPVRRDLDPKTLARIALRANNAYYFAETQMVFIEYQTGFGKDFRGH